MIRTTWQRPHLQFAYSLHLYLPIGAIRPNDAGNADRGSDLEECIEFLDDESDSGENIQSGVR